MAPATTDRPLRIANCSGFYGDRLSAFKEMLEGGPVDVLTGDYLAELTMFLLWRAREKDPATGYAATFVKQMEGVLAPAVERGVKIVTNAGGLNPAGLAGTLKGLADKIGLRVRIAHVEGDDLMPRLAELAAAGQRLAHADTGQPLSSAGGKPVTANAYLGGWGIAAALGAGADLVVCGRVSDASLVVGPAAWRFGWARDDWDALAGAVVAGHVIECGAQATGGNYAFFTEIASLARPGFPIAEVSADGSAVITKHPGTGGEVSLGTVTAQLVYEIEGPRYANPDVVARFDTVRLEPDGADRVRVFGARGEPAPATLKVGISVLAGYRNGMTLVLTGLDVEAKARLVSEGLAATLGARRPARLETRLVRSDRPGATTSEEASTFLHLTALDPDPRKVGRGFSGALVEMALASYPGLHATAPPGEESPYAVYWPALVPRELVPQRVVMDDGSAREIVSGEGVVEGAPAAPMPVAAPSPPAGATERLPLGTVFGARSGDKGGNANVGVWARSEAGLAWLVAHLTVDRFKELLPEAAPFAVTRHVLANLRAVNFVVVGLLGDGALASTRLDAQAKGLGEFLRSRLVDLPVSLLADAPTPAGAR
jgi:hypothetical protein